MQHAVGREVGLDLARAGAVVSMYVAHTAPSPGPGNILELSEFLTAALFATLVGAGTQLSADHRGGGPWWRVHAAAVVRGAALVVTGLLLETWDAQVVIILVYLGVLTVLMSAVARLPSWGVGVVAVAFLGVGPLLRDLADAEWERRLRQGAQSGDLVPRVLEIAGAGDAYRIVTLVVWACLGMLLVRRWTRRPGDAATAAPVPRAELVVVTVAGLAFAGAVLLGWPDAVAPYSGERLEVLVDAALAAAAVAGSLLVADLAFPGRGTSAQVGRMTLTLYVVQVGWLALVARSRPGEPDDSWVTLVLLVVVSYAIAAAWPRVVRSGPFARGPLEGLVDLGAGALRRRR